MNQTIRLLTLIGSPYAPACQFQMDELESHRLLNYATLNKIPLLYLDALRRRKQIGGLESFYKHNYARHCMFLDIMTQSALSLQEAGIPYCIFKTIKPYLAETSDIDIIVLDDNDFQNAARVIGRRWPLKGYGPQSMTFYDAEADLGIDLHREIAVSHVVYADRNILSEFTTVKTLPNNARVVTLSPPAELFVMAAHSTIKEQIFTLAEYFTFIYHSSQMSKGDIRNFIQLTKENRNVQATVPFLAVASFLHETVHRIRPKVLSEIYQMFSYTSNETNILSRRGMKMPHKYSLMTVTRAILEKMREDKVRKSFLLQLSKMAEISFALEVLDQLLSHYMRATY